jgi:hypothetical protein
MLKWMGNLGAKSDHPFADAKKVKKLISKLPVDSFRAVEDIASWLESLSKTGSLTLERRYEIVDLIDQAAKPYSRKLSQDYLRAPRLEKLQENRLWTANFEFWKHLTDAYLSCLEQYQAGVKSTPQIAEALPIIVARGTRALATQLKWALLRYGPVEGGIWADLGRLYAFAESNGFAEKVITIYPGAQGDSSVEQEFVTALMLAASSPDSLVPMQLEIAERLVAHLSGLFTLGDEAGEARTHYFDLSMHKPPARLAKGIQKNETIRFLGAAAGKQELKRLMTQTEAGSIPKEVNLGAPYETTTVLEVMRHLEQYWSEKPPSRRHERSRAVARLSVVHGFSNVVEGVFKGTQIDDKAETTESWIAENVSEGGYGTIVPRVKNDWVEVGSLLGVRSEKDNQWGVGVIRRVNRDELRQRHVGIQYLAKTAIPIKLRPLDPPKPAIQAAPTKPTDAAAPKEQKKDHTVVVIDYETGDERVETLKLRRGDNPVSDPAAEQKAAATKDSRNKAEAKEASYLWSLLLSSRPDNTGEISLLMRARSFFPEQRFEMLVQEKGYLLTSAKLLESGTDYDLAKFRVVEEIAKSTRPPSPSGANPTLQ